MDQRVSFITLGVADLEKSEAFYRALGWKPSSYGQGLGVSFFQISGGLVLALYPRHELTRDACLQDRGPPPSGGFSLSYNTRSRAEVDQVMADVERIGGRVTKTPGEIFWGGYLGYFTDPDGHLWEVVHNPKAEPGADGAIRLPE